MTAIERLKNASTASAAPSAKPNVNAIDRLKNADTTRGLYKPEVQPVASKPVKQEASVEFDFSDFIGNTIKQGLSEIAQAGGNTLAFLERNTAGRGMGLLTGDSEFYKTMPFYQWNESIKKEAQALDEKTRANTEAGGKAAQVAETLGAGAIAALPQLYAAIGTGGTSLAANGLAATSTAAQSAPTVLNAAKSAAAKVAKNPQYWTSFLSSVGNDYESAKQNGFNDSKATLYALGTSLMNAAVEIGGGIQSLPSELQGGKGAFRTWVNTMVDEGKEGAVQGIISRGMENVFGADNPIFSIKDENAVLNPVTIGKDAALEAAVGGILSAVPSAINASRRNSAEGSSATQTAPSEGSNAPQVKTPQRGSESDSEDVMVGEARRLFEQKNPPAQGTGYAATDLGRPSAPLGVSATQKDNTSVAPSAGNASENVDPLLKLLTGGKRVDQSTLTNEQFDTLADRGDIGMDAKGRVFQMDPDQHIDLRRSDEMGNRKINAFQFDHPEIQPYYKEAAAALLDELSVVEKGGQLIKRGNYRTGEEYFRTKRGASKRISSLLDDYGLSYAQIEKACNAIINDQGQENIAAAKRVEFVLDEMLSDGYQSMVGFIPANQNYLAAKAGIVGSQAGVERESMIPDDLDAVPGDDGLGAAEAGFTTPDSKSETKTSRTAETTMGYNSVEGEATGLNAEQYAELLKYKTLTEKMATQQADDMLYVQQDGQQKFIRDVDEAAYQDITSWLKMAPAWDAPMTDAAHMIRNELKGRAVNGEITQEEYVAWLETMREHATASGQGVQAQAKWSRTDNRGGAATELEAQKALENSKLPPEEQARIFRQIVQWDAEIEAVQSGDTASLKAIIMRAARERGVVNGLFGDFFARRAESALDVLTFDQLKQFAYSSTAALANDSTPANAGRKMKTIQILNMLSKPTTPARNLTGNTTFYGLDALAMNGASLIDMAVAKLTGTRSVAAEGLPDMRAAAKAMQMAIAEITLDIDMGGETTRYGTGSSRTFKMGGTGVFNTNTAADKFVERTLSSLERNLNYLLVATDEFYKGAARATESKTQALIDEGKIKTTDKEYAKKQADELAKVRTFQDNSKVAAIIQGLHDLGNLIGFGDSGKTMGGLKVRSFGLGDFVAPFARVAGNLVSRGIEYSPLNAVKGTVEIVNQVVNAASGKEVDAAKQAKGVSGVARGMTGTAVAYGFMLLVKAGLMRQAEDERDKDVAALNQSEGMRGTQLNLSAAQRAINGESAEWRYGDTLVDLSSVEPLNLLMNLGAEMAKEPENPLLSSFGDTFTSIGNAAAELPVLENVGEFVKDVTYYKTDWKEAAGEMAANTAISSVVPNILSGIATGLDDRPRNVYTGDDLWDYIQDSFKSRIPGLRETLPGNTNSLGEEKTYQGSQDSLIASLFSPVGINTYMQGDVSTELERVREATGGDISFYPESTIPGELSHDNKKVELTYDQRQEFQSVRGNTHSSTVEKMKSIKAYKNASATEQAALLNRCKDYAYQIAKASVMGNDTLESWALNAKNAQSDLGVSTAEYLALYEKYEGKYLSGDAYEKTKQAAKLGLTVDEYVSMKKGADTNGNGRVDSDETKAMLKNNPQRADLWDIFNTTGAKNPYK